MRTIWKYEAEVADSIEFQMPVSAKILHVGTQRHGHICLWALVDTDKMSRPRKFRVFGTGHNVWSVETDTFIGTVQDGAFVWHVFERP